MRDHTVERPPWWETTLWKDCPDERPPHWKTTMMRDHTVERPPLWETTLLKDYPDNNTPWCKLSLMRLDKATPLLRPPSPNCFTPLLRPPSPNHFTPLLRPPSPKHFTPLLRPPSPNRFPAYVLVVCKWTKNHPSSLQLSKHFHLNSWVALKERFLCTTSTFSMLFTRRHHVPITVTHFFPFLNLPCVLVPAVILQAPERRTNKIMIFYFHDFFHDFFG